MNRLLLQNLTKTYKNGVKAIDDVSLTINNGMFGLLGPNGAGKSTLMRTIASLQAPDAGEIIFNDNNVLEEPDKIRKKLGYLPQEFGVYPKISAYKLLDHLAVLKGILNNKERKEQVELLLHQTNLYNERKKSVSNFSGGMKQRFGIAQALLGNPQIIIVDEPTAGLDPEERNRFNNLLSEIGENVIVILSTHIVEDIRELCSKMAILAEGKLILEGEPQKLINELHGKVWRKTIKKESLEAYKTSFKIISQKLLGGETQISVFSNECPESGFEQCEPSLEDVYFSNLFNYQQTGR